MTPKEKAEKLIEKYNQILPNWEDNEDAKQCALIAVDEVKWFHKKLFYLTDGSLFDKYLDDVKQEINKL